MNVDTAHDAVLQRLIAWAEAHDEIRALLMTSTRAIPGAELDTYSDYDIILIVRDIHRFLEDRTWIEAFGNVLVAYWNPVWSADDTERAGNVVQYVDGLKIDFSLREVGFIQHIVSSSSLPAEFDAGYVVLLDKDAITCGLREPTFAGYVPERPDEVTFLLNVNDFFIGVPYVAKCLLRDELWPAKWCMDYDMRFVYLQPMLEWRIECDHAWSLPVKINGKGLKRHFPAATWSELDATFTGASIDDNWDALVRLIEVYGKIARQVAIALEYTYPDSLQRDVTNHAIRMKNREFEQFAT